MHCLYFLMIMLVTAQTVDAKVVESLKYKYYDVKVADNQSLLDALNQASSLKSWAQKHHANTDWKVAMDFRVRPDNHGRCRISSSTTTIRATILLPRLVKATKSQKSRFKVYVTALKKHELGHYQIGKDAARAIDRQISTYPAANNCQTLGKSANDAAHQTLEKYKNIEREYDEKTNHGRSQGAWLAN